MSPRPSLRPFLLTASLLTPLLFGAPLAAQSGAVSEYAVKSALLFRLPQFVYRQGERNPAFGMCVLGSNPFGGALEKLAQAAPIDGRPVKVVRLADAGDAAECDFVFIARSEAGGLDALLRRLNRASLVTVSDIEGFARAGGMVELALGDGGGVTLLLNRKAAQRHNVEFNAQLLRLARVVEP